MLKFRKSEDRGQGEHGWLSSRHTFSFANYYDPRFTGFRDLLVINEDRVQASQGFGTHSHRDMEIISYVLSGALEHADSMGTGSVIRPGDIQRMSAGTGVSHSEYNHSPSELVHFLQIWIKPQAAGLKPGYEQKAFSDDEKRGQLRLVVSQDGRDGSVRLNQDTNIYASLLEPSSELTYTKPEGRHVWIHVAKGRVSINGEELSGGDAAYTSDEPSLSLRGVEKAEIILFELA